MIIFLTTGPHQYTHREVVEKARGRIDIRLLSYDALFRAQNVQTATYIFADLDRLSGPDLSNAAIAYRRLHAAGMRVLNDPARFYSRFGLLRMLFRARINDFDVYRVEERSAPKQWPVFMRRVSGHKEVSSLLAGPKELQEEMRKWVKRGVPISDLLIVEYAGEEVQPGLYRKLSTFKIGLQSLATTNVHQDNWHAKTGVKGIATSELYRDELRIVKDNPYREKILEVFKLSCTDYGRVDYGFFKGRIQIFEINTNPHVRFATEHPAPDRIESYRVFRENYLSALKAIDSPPGAPVAKKKVLPETDRRSDPT